MKQIIKVHLLIAASILISFVSFAQTDKIGSDKVLGTYWSPKKDAKIEVYKQGNRYFGKTVWVAVAKKDSKNPDEALRKRELLGVNLLTDFKYHDGEYSDGEIYDPESGKTYKCKMTLIGRDLKVRGYIGISLFGRTEIFRNVQ